MRAIDELCTLIKNKPEIIVDIDWADETDCFDIQRMHEFILKLNDIDLINSVNKMICSTWELLKSQDDSRCYTTTSKGEYELKFPDNSNYLNEPYYENGPAPFTISTRSLSGVLYLIKSEAMRTLLPVIKHKALRERLLDKYSSKNGKIKTINQEEKDWPERVELSFFDKRLYSTAEEQHKLREILQSEQNNIDTTNGREWFAYYAAYRYVKNLLNTKKNYVAFFSDIEKLLPDALTRSYKDKKGDERYKHYTMQLSKEVNNWYVDKGKLPPINRLVRTDYNFHCSEELFNKLQLIIRNLYKQLHDLENKLNEEKGVKK